MSHPQHDTFPDVEGPLAVQGGQGAFAHMRWTWPPQHPRIWRALEELWHSGHWGQYHAPVLEEVREKLRLRFSVSWAWLCSSGTVAVELALRALGVGPRDEVLLAGYDFPGNFRAIECIGARPVLLDLAPHSWHLDPQLIAQACSPQTKALVVSHLHGTLAPMDQIMDLARSLNLGVVEDASQCPGAWAQGRPMGSWADVGVISFGGSKLLSAGRGGALLGHDPVVLQRLKIFAQRGNDAFPLSALQAAVLLPQLELLDQFHKQRLQGAQVLLKELGSCEHFRLPRPARTEESPGYYKLGWWLVGVERDGQVRERFLEAARAEGIPLGEGFRGFVYRGARRCRRGSPLEHAFLAAQATVLLHHPVLLQPPEVLQALGRRIAQVAQWAAEH